MRRLPPSCTRPYTLVPYTTLCRSAMQSIVARLKARLAAASSASATASAHALGAIVEEGSEGEGRAHLPALALSYFFNLFFNRSEEHTSELQSLMRNSYAVFCLKKKNT